MNEVRKTSRSTWVGILVLVGWLLLMLVVVLPRGGHPREYSNRTACAGNLKDIMRAMYIYASDNHDMFPFVVTQTLRQVGAEPGVVDTGSTKTAEAARSFYTPGDRRATQCLWLLEVLGTVRPEHFVCRSDAAEVGLEAVSMSNPNRAGDFGSSRNLSYSMASPWVEVAPMPASGPAAPVRAPWWRYSGDAAQPLLADGIKAGADFGNAEAVCPNHKGQGGNVAFADGHVEWVPITQRGNHHALIAPAETTNEDSSGVFATGAVFPSGRYVTPTTITATKLGGVYDMIFVPPLVGR